MVSHSSRFSLLQTKAGQPVALLIQRSRASNNQQQQLSRRRRWMQPPVSRCGCSIQVVEQVGRNGYVHLWSYAGEQYQQKQEELLYGRFKDADGLVLDLREAGVVQIHLSQYLHTRRGPLDGYST